MCDLGAERDVVLQVENVDEKLLAEGAPHDGVRDELLHGMAAPLRDYRQGVVCGHVILVPGVHGRRHW
jgi:hypothetical protein